MDIDSFKAAAEGSEKLVTWALALTGSSLAMILGTDHVDTGKKFRPCYLLFAPAWICFAISIQYGIDVWRKYMAAQFGDRSAWVEIQKLIGKDFLNQLFWLQAGLALMGIWLIVFLYWWIVIDGRAKRPMG